jgi:UPF0716 protein FxsA
MIVFLALKLSSSIYKQDTVMIKWLVILFTIIPLVELTLLIIIGQHVGVIYTILMLLVTGLLGAWFARQQGFYVITRIQMEISQGRMPTDSLLDGLLVFTGALLLITPGLLTDVAGFTLLVPFSRAVIRKRLRQVIQQRMQRGSASTHIYIRPDDWSSRDGKGM